MYAQETDSSDTPDGGGLVMSALSFANKTAITIFSVGSGSGTIFSSSSSLGVSKIISGLGGIFSDLVNNGFDKTTEVQTQDSIATDGITTTLILNHSDQWETN